MSYRTYVRLAEPSEEGSVMELCRELHAENGIFPLDEEKVRGMLRRAFNREGGVLGVVGAPGQLEGMVYMFMSTFWYSQKPHWEELFVYVRPAFRAIRTTPPHKVGVVSERQFSRVRALADFTKWCADETGFPLIIGVISDERTEGKVRLYTRFFGKPVGNFFYYEPQKQAS